MAAEDVSGKVGLDTTDWKTGVRQLQKDVRVLESSFKAVAAGMDDWKKDADGLTKRNETLSQVITKQQGVVDALTAEYERMRAEAAANGDETEATKAALQDFEIKLNSARAALNKSKTEYRQNAAALEDMAKGGSDAGKATQDIGTKAEATEKKTSKLGATMKTVANTIKTGFVAAVKAATAALAAAATAAAAAVAAMFDLGTGYNQAMNSLGAKTGATGAELEELGDIATNVYRNNFGENMSDVADGVAAVKNNTGLLGEELQRASENSFALRDAFGYDIPETSRTAAALMKNLGITADEAYDLIATGAQNGADKNGDMLDTLNEYANQYQKLGLSADQMMQSLISGSENGAFSIDKVGDAVKEFSIRAVDGSDTSRQAFKDLGFNADTMFKSFAAGGDTAQGAFFDVLTALQNIEDPLKRNEIGVALFGTQFEDLGEEALPILMSMADESTNAAGAMEQLNAVQYDDAKSALNGLKRVIETSLLPIASEVSNAFKAFATDATKALADGFQPEDIGVIVTSFQTNINNILSMATQYLPLITTAINAVVTEVVNMLPGLVTTLLPAAMGIVQGLLDAITTNVEPIMNMCMTLISSIGTFLIQNVPTLMETAKSILTTFMQYITENSAEISAGATAIINTLVTGITALLPDLIPLAVTMLATLATDLIAAIPNLVAQLPTIVAAIYNGIAAVDWVALAADLITGLAGALVSSVTSLAEQIAPFASGLWDTIKNTDWIALAGECITGLVNALVAGVSGLGELLAPFVSGIWDTLKNTDWIQLGTDLLQGLVNGLNTAVTTLLESITGVFQNIWNAILGVFGIASPSTEAAAAAGFILDGLLEGFSSAVGAVCETVKQIFGKIWDAIKSIFGFGSESEESKEAKQAGTDIMTGMSDGITGSEDKVKTAVTNASKNALKQFRTELGIPENNGASTKGKTYGESVVLGIRDGIKDKGVSDTFTGAASAGKSAIASAFNSAFGIAGTGILGTGTQAASQFKGIGTAVAEGIANGIKDGASKITSAAKTAANNALAAAKRQLGIASPSREAYKQVGTPFVQGIANALTDGTRTLRDSVTNAVGSMTSVTVNPIRLDGSSMQQTVQPIRAQLVLKEKTFGEIVLDMANRGQGNQAANMSRLNMGVSIA